MSQRAKISLRFVDWTIIRRSRFATRRWTQGSEKGANLRARSLGVDQQKLPPWMVGLGKGIECPRRW
jgi:hypothetical protein